MVVGGGVVPLLLLLPLPMCRCIAVAFAKSSAARASLVALCASFVQAPPRICRATPGLAEMHHGVVSCLISLLRRAPGWLIGCAAIPALRSVL